MKKRTLTVTVISAAAAAALSLCAFSASRTVFAAGGISYTPKETKSLSENSGLIDSGLHVRAGSDEESAGTGLLQLYGLPSSYSLVENGESTGVRNQNPYNTCWAFSALASAESNLIKNGYAATSVDLSEAQLSYYTYNRSSANQPEGCEGDTVSLVDTTFAEVGGNDFNAITSLDRWVGAVNESKAPYSEMSGISYDDSTMAYGSNSYVLMNADMYSMKDTSTIKNLLMNKGALSVGICYDDSYLNSLTNSYYCPEAFSGNHAVTLVGWDDSYAVSNFRSGKQPSSAGAWLVKNSWGKNWGDGGYFWISYQDASLLLENATSYEFVPADQSYDNLYQYDGGIDYDYFTSDGSSGYMANVFKADGEETLKAVSFMTDDIGISYRVDIYTNVSGKPTTGTLVKSAEVSGTQKAAGYHSVVLPEPVSLTKGEKYAVVVRLTAGSGSSSVNLLCENSVKYNYMTQSSHCDAGESYISDDGSTWEDCYSYNVSYGLGNLRIKAFTDDGASSDSTTTTSVVWDRLGGSNRYATAALVAREAFSKADEGILVSGENWPDALAASSLAGIKKIPILITNKKQLNAATASLISELGIKKITIIGSTASVSADVEEQLASECGIAASSITRCEGKNRVETAEKIYESESGSLSADACVIASGATPADALSISPWTYYYGMPVFLTRSGELSDQSLSYAKTFKKAYILGSDASVDGSVDTALQASGVTVKRLYGDTRYETSVEIAKYFCSSAGYYDKAAFANGGTDYFPDALCGAMLQGSFPAPIILVNSTSSAPYTFVRSNLSGASVTKLYVLGGKPSVSEETVAALKTALAS